MPNQNILRGSPEPTTLQHPPSSLLSLPPCPKQKAKKTTHQLQAPQVAQVLLLRRHQQRLDVPVGFFFRVCATSHVLGRTGGLVSLHVRTGAPCSSNWLTPQIGRAPIIRGGGHGCARCGKKNAPPTLPGFRRHRKTTSGKPAAHSMSPPLALTRHTAKNTNTADTRRACVSVHTALSARRSASRARARVREAAANATRALSHLKLRAASDTSSLPSEWQTSVSRPSDSAIAIRDATRLLSPR